MEATENPYKLLLEAASMIPKSHYVIAFSIFGVIYFYNYLEFHFLEDLRTGFRGSPVSLSYHSSSQLYHQVVSNCRILHGRYLATPWLSSPHLQTVLLELVKRPAVPRYRRKLFHASDGGTFALDWLLSADVSGSTMGKDNVISKEDTTPIAVIIPGLTSDSASVYLRHLAINTAKRGWNVVICNHRGLGGVSVTSDRFYNAGWSTDTRDVINYLHHEYPKAPLFAIGTSIGANILVKYLGEDGENVPVSGAAAICCPWDLLIGSRYIVRRLVQKVYDMALAIGLRGYAQTNQPHFSRLADWEGIEKSRSIRDFDNYATCLVGNFETVDTYYRLSSSAPFTRFVSVPLLCISSLDDPLCTAEAIPWDECRWVRAVNEFLGVLHSSTFMHTQKKMQFSGRHSASESLIDQGPYVNLADGMVSAIGNEPDTKAYSATVLENKEDSINSDFKLLDASKSRRALDQHSQHNKKAI